jgi:ADP-heptose:LPS heptosyltransferase
MSVAPFNPGKAASSPVEGEKSHSETRKKVRILVIQLARLGDTLQSLMALRAAKQLYPQLEVHMVVRGRFADAAKNCPWISGVHVLPTDEWIPSILQAMKEKNASLDQVDFRSVIGPAAAWLAPLVDEPWHLAFNWTYSDSSSWLTALIPAYSRYGYIRRKDLSAGAADGWSHYVQAIVQQQSPQNIHLTDILTTQLLTALQLHVGDPEQEATSRETLSHRFFNIPKTALDGIRDEGREWRDPSRKWIGFQLGAGHPAKSWDSASWAELAVRILSRHGECNLVLLGNGEADRKTADHILEQLRENGLEDRSVLSLVDQTDFQLWAAIVGRSQWIFSGDTSVIHLASVLGTRVVNLSIGPVRHMETGPYGNGHFVLQPDITCAACAGVDGATSHRCREVITADIVYATWSYGASEWAHRRETSFEEHLKQIGSPHIDEKVRIFRSRIRLSEEGGGVNYELVQREKKLLFAEWSAAVTGHVARAWYCGWTPQVASETQSTALNPDLVRDLRKVSESVDVLIKVAEEGRRTSQQIQREAVRNRTRKVMRVEERARLQELALKLSEIDRLLERLVRAQPCFSPFLALQRVMMHNLSGDDISDLGRQSALVWDQVVSGARVWREWLDATTTLIRPRAVQNLKKEKPSPDLSV